VFTKEYPSDNVRVKHLALLLLLPEHPAYAQYPNGGCSCFSLVPPGAVTWPIATARLRIVSSPSFTVYLTIEGCVNKTCIKCEISNFRRYIVGGPRFSGLLRRLGRFVTDVSVQHIGLILNDLCYLDPGKSDRYAVPKCRQ